MRDRREHHELDRILSSDNEKSKPKPLNKNGLFSFNIAFCSIHSRKEPPRHSVLKPGTGSQVTTSVAVTDKRLYSSGADLTPTQQLVLLLLFKNRWRVSGGKKGRKRRGREEEGGGQGQIWVQIRFVCDSDQAAQTPRAFVGRSLIRACLCVLLIWHLAPVWLLMWRQRFLPRKGHKLR